jgi:aryl-alcohol dehydrogenase-like predicted oxidoreductase
VLPTLPFGSTGHESTRLIFGAAALARVDEAQAARALELVLELGINHIDTAASYGDAEVRLAPWLRQHRDRFFLATKTGDRDAVGARESLHRSLERMGVDRVDLLQLHNLVKEDEWAVAFGPGGALEAAIEARDQGLVRFIGVTGHGTRVARMHARSLERFPFDSVLLPCSRILLKDATYAAEFDALAAECARRGVAVQTIKAVARRRWPEGADPTYSTWYEPLVDRDDIEREIHWVLERGPVFVNSASDLRLLADSARAVAAHAEGARGPDSPEPIPEDMEPLFIRGFGQATA